MIPIVRILATKKKKGANPQFTSAKLLKISLSTKFSHILLCVCTQKLTYLLLILHKMSNFANTY